MHSGPASTIARAAGRTLALVLALTAPAAAPAAEATGAGAASGHRLADSASPYLMLHAGNPVEWHPWGPEAFARARAEDKPIFLSVGYSTCFWCHVAERTLFSDPAIAALMNRWFVNVKVDREQRPDVDRVYMLAREILSGSGGWPNNVFLTPDLEPFYAGSYFPPARDADGRPGFPEVLEAIHRAWTDRRGEVLANARRLQSVLRRVAGPGGDDGPADVDPAAWRSAAVRALLARFDSLQGGFTEEGRPMKFPRTPALVLLLSEHRATGDEAVAEALTGTLDAMAYGGIQDHLAGGFHRYSTDPDWSIPHFEKMLYDNVQLLRVYAEAYEQLGAPLYRYTAERIARYLRTRMQSPQGGFYTAEDAQVDGVEGLSYVWTPESIGEVLDAETARRFLEVYALEPLPHIDAALRAASAPVPEGGAVLRLSLPVSEALEAGDHASVTAMLESLAPAREALLARRDRRKAPLRDEKLGVDLNGMAIDAFATAGRALGEPELVDVARRAARRVWAAAYDESSGTLSHQVFRGEASGAAFLADYAHFARGLLSLHAVTGERVWRVRARRLADAMLDRFLGPDGRLALSPAAGELPVPLADDGDLDAPSGTSAALEVLVALGATEDGERHAGAAAGLLRHQAAEVAGYPDAWPALLVALDAPAASAVVQAAAAPPEGGPAGGGEAFALKSSADFVTAGARLDREASRVVITLQVAEGYHINANPASLEFLIPTRVAFTGASPRAVHYPSAKQFRPSFTDTALDVYEGTATITADFPSTPAALAQDLSATVTVQACNDTVCFLPSRIQLTPVR